MTACGLITLDERIRCLIDEKASEMNPNAYAHCEHVSAVIQQFNDFIDGDCNLSTDRIEGLLDHLVGFFTITLDLPLESGIKVLRAVKFDNINEPLPTNTTRLSYIPFGSEITPKLGRMNKGGESIYYGCIHFDDYFGGVNVAFAEVDALPYERINILRSETKQGLTVRFIGIYELVKRKAKPYFLQESAFEYWCKVYRYQEETFKSPLLIAFQLCDAFFADILSRPGSPRLYEVTSVLSSMFLEDERVDGLIYSSVQAIGSPVIAIKPASVDKKLEHESATSYEIKRSFGYAMFDAITVAKGTITDKNIIWAELTKN